MPTTRPAQGIKRRRPVAAGDQYQLRWNEILATTAKLFRERGFDGTSIKDVSDSVGMLKGSLYYYINGKEDLLVAILRGLHTDGERIVAEVDFDAENPLAELQTYLRKAIVFAGENAERLAIFIRDFRHVPVKQQREIISERDMYVSTTQRLIEDAAAKGLLRAEIDTRVAALSIMGAVSGTHEWLRPIKGRSFEETADQISRMLVYGLG